jgi:hypothetical protein
MAETQAWRAGRIRQGYCEAPAAGGGRSRRHRAGVRLWTLLRAPALLRGGTGDPYDVMFIEDDYRRLSARRSG